MKPDQGIADVADEFVQFLGDVGKPFIRRDERKQRHAEKGGGVALGADNDPAQDRHHSYNFV